MGADNFVNRAVGGNRAARRSRVLLAARLQTPAGEIDARLRDLSRKGALVECAVQPDVGSEVVFVRGNTRVPARVAWAAAGRVGLEFQCMIDEQEVLVQLNGKADSSIPEFYSRRPLGHRMSTRDRRLAMAWGVNVGLAVPDQDS